MLKLADIVEAMTGRYPTWGAVEISGAVVDSRQAESGSLFVALRGEKLDGHDFVQDAFSRGAKLALIDREVEADCTQLDLRGKRFPVVDANPAQPLCLLVDDSLKALQKIAAHWRSKLDLRVIGITGSVGKSTTKEVVASVLGQRYRVVKNSGNLNNEIGLPLTILRLDETTERAVLEMGLYVPGEIAFLCGIAKPHVGVVTNVGMVHAERAGSQEAIAKGKAELVQALPPAPEGVAILNIDDPWVRKMAEGIAAQVFFYGLNPEADLWVDDVESLGLEGIRFRLHFRNETVYLRVPMIGRHSVHTALRAAAVGLVEDLTWQEIVSGLRSPHTQLRLVTVRAKNGALMLDDTYNASPQSMLAALNLLNEMNGRKVAVLGDMLELGPYEKTAHRMVGVRAAEVADKLVTIGKLGKIIASAARDFGFPRSAISAFDDNRSAIDYLTACLHEGDVVLIKGSRGMHMEEIVAALEENS